MTDRFAHCKPGDIVTVTVRGEFARDDDGWPHLGTLCLADSTVDITSVTIEPRPLQVGDAVLSPNGTRGKIRAIEGDYWAWILFDGFPLQRFSYPISELRRAP
jgi:hypothetical protein